MSRQEEISAAIARSAAWWKDHGPFVRAESAQREREDNGRRVFDWAFREKELLAEKLNRSAVRQLGLNKPVKPSKPYPAKPSPWVGDKYFFSPSGRIIPTNEEHYDYAGTTPAVVEKTISATLREYERREAEAEFAAHAEAETGMQMSEAEFKKKKKAEVLVRIQTAEIAARLEAAGVQALRTDGFKMFVHWIHSRTTEELPSYRRICLLPYIAAMTRAPKLAALEYFLQDNPFARFWTFTTGTRCLIEEVPARLDWLFSKLRELNKKLAGWGVEIVFRSTEFGRLEADDAGNRASEDTWGAITRDAQGRPLYHPHAHCVIINKRGFIRPERWSAMIEFVHEFWKRDGQKIHWDAGKMIGSPRECCKYVVKPGDVLKLSNEELRAFYEATANRRLVRPMGILAKQIRDRKEGPMVLRRVRVGSRLQWAEKLNHNKLNAESEAEKAELNNLQDAYAFTEECQQLARLEPPSAPGALDGGAPVPRGISADVTKVMARIGPAAGPTPFKEPRVLVMTNLERPCMRSVNTHPLVFKLWSQTVESWEAGRALDSGIRLHTGTLSGTEFQHDLPDFDPPPDPDSICAPFLAEIA